MIINFYPFEAALEKKSADLDAMLENIDIGGPALVRAAAKNFKNTVVLIDEKDYGPVMAAIESGDDVPLESRKRLAQKAFAYTSFYDSLIASYLAAGQEAHPDFATIGGRREQSLRYGENPHQSAFLAISDRRSPFHAIDQLHGKALSFNNILDLAMVYELLNEFQGKSTSRPSSSTRIPAAPPWLPARHRLSGPRSPATRARPTAASSASTTAWSPKPPRPWPRSFSRSSSPPTSATRP